MKFLSFERRYALDGGPCDRCSGTGQYSRPARNGPRDCLNCRGLGRKLTRAARQLYLDICELLGSPSPFRESRIRPNHLELVFGRDVASGMAIAPYGDLRAPALTVKRVDRAPGLVVLWLDNKTKLGGRETESFRRVLTPAELTRVDAVLAEHLGNGAVSRRSLLPRRRRV